MGVPVERVIVPVHEHHASTYLRRRSDSRRPTSCEIIGEVRSRWRMKLALRGAVRVVAVVVGAVPRWPRTAWSGRGSAPASIIAARVLLAARRRRVRRLLPGAAAAASGHRRAGRAVSRGDTSRRCRRRCVSAVEAQPRGTRAGVAGPRAHAWSSRRSKRCASIERRRAASKQAPLRRWGVGARRPDAPSRFLRCCSVPRSCATRCRRCCSCQRSVEAAAPYRIEVHAGQRHRAQGCGSDDHRQARGFDAEDAVADGAADARRRVRGAAAGARRERPLRGHALRRRRAARVLRRGRRRPVAGLQR